MVTEFQKGFQGRTPTQDTIIKAFRIFKATARQESEKDFYVDEHTGALAFMIRLQSGLLLLGELPQDSALSAATYPDGKDQTREVRFLSNASAEDIIKLIQDRQGSPVNTQGTRNAAP